MSRRSRLILFLLLSALPGSVCSEPGAPQPEQTQPLALLLELADEKGALATNFQEGEPIALRLTLANRSDAAASLGFASAKTYDMIIQRADGSEAWRWSQGRMFAQMLSEIAVEPGAEWVFEARCDAGANLSPGRYSAVGVVPAMGAALRSEAVRFEVR